MSVQPPSFSECLLLYYMNKSLLFRLCCIDKSSRFRIAMKFVACLHTPGKPVGRSRARKHPMFCWTTVYMRALPCKYS